MSQVTITINNKEYAVDCEDGQEVRIIQLAGILDDRAKMFGAEASKINESTLLCMVGLILADELTESKKSANKSASQVVDNKGLLEVDEVVAKSLKSLLEGLKGVAKKIDLL